MSTTPPRVKLLAGSLGRSACRDCGALIEWRETPAGKRMPLNADVVPVLTEHDTSRRLIEIFDSSDTHWATCPGAARFKRPSGGRT